MLSPSGSCLLSFISDMQSSLSGSVGNPDVIMHPRLVSLHVVEHH